MIPLTRALAERRQALIARSREQRADVMFSAQPIARGVNFLDTLAGVVRARPLAVTLAVVALVAFGPRKLLLWGLRVAPLLTFLRRF